MLAQRPWAFERLRNYETATLVPERRCAEVDEGTFARDWYQPARPVVVRGAVRAWPCMTRWRNWQELAERIPAGTPVVVQSMPRIEETSLLRMLRHQREGRRGTAYCRHMTFAQFVGATRSKEQYQCLHAQTLDQAPFDVLRQDLAEFSFLRPRREFLGSYPAWSAFLFRGSYTDWHWHPAVDAMMCQIQAAKEVLLVQPDWSSWSAIHRLGTSERWSFETDHQVLDALSSRLTWWRAVVEPGDALFIPAYWWHAVRATDELERGITLTTWFDPPRHTRFSVYTPGSLHFWAYFALLLAQGHMTAKQALSVTGEALVGYAESLVRGAQLAPSPAEAHDLPSTRHRDASSAAADCAPGGPP